MGLPPHAADWVSQAEIDYIGPFVKAWAAFNAWYRYASGHTQEREMLDFVIAHPNSTLRRRLLPLLDNDNQTSDAQTLKQAISDLQLKLDAIQFEITRKGIRERISLRSVCLRPRALQQQSLERNGQEYKAAKIRGGEIRVTVYSLRNGVAKFDFCQARYDPEEVYSHPDFTSKLSESQRVTLRQFYNGCNPRPMSDLVQGGGPALLVGAMEFQCLGEHLLSGVVEVIYSMRNALLHGEVDPDRQVLLCYEAAYRIVMAFLACIR
jgi:hypothetical protein